jgi:ParB family transcriptional regulator, chromosome partitioning protein
MVKRSVLGRGFDVLIPKDLDVSILDEDKHRVQKLLIEDIHPNPEQPRRSIDQASLDELTDSIVRHGVLQPIIVVANKGRKGYRIVAGERRWRAAKSAKLSHIPAIVRSLEELEEIELSLIENLQRVDLSPLEQALSVYKLQQQFNLKLEQIAKKLGKAPSTVSNMTRLLQLPDNARQAFQNGQISEGHARAVLSLNSSPDRQQELLNCIINNGWTVRQAEQYVVAVRAGANSSKAASHTASESTITRQISQKLDTSVKVKHTAKGGQLIISFSSDSELEKIANKIVST